MTQPTVVPAKKPFDAVIFDLDGTLLDSLQDIGNAANEVLLQLGLPPRSLEDYRTLVGDGVSVLFQRAIPDCAQDEILRARCIKSFEATYAEQWNRHSRAYDGIETLLEALRRADVPMAVLSNKPEAFTQQCVAHFFPRTQFAFVIGHSERFPRKPDPTSANWIAQALHVQPSSVAYVGDTDTDMKTAVGAGFHAVGVTWGFRTEAELVAHGARVAIHSPHALKQYLLQT
jgi:phosphoglycolate phosphatase